MATQKWVNPPVMYTIAQIRFNQILAMENYVPAIQEELRRIGFSGYRKDVINALTISIGQPDGPQQILQPVSRHIFSDRENTSGFTLETNALSFQTADYNVFETFLKIFRDVLSIVHDKVSLDYIERIGVRYLDAVVPKEGDEIEQYLTTEVLGMSNKVKTFKSPGKLVHSYTETVSSNEAAGSTLVAKVVIQNGKMSLPPEIAQVSYPIKEKFLAVNGPFAIIDTDGFKNTDQMPFDLEMVCQTLDDLHLEISESFKETATALALKFWEFGD